MAFQIRDAHPEDVPALARLHVQTFNETHRGGRDGGPSFELRERQWHEAFSSPDRSWFCFVVEDDAGELIGFAKGTLHDGGVPGFVGEPYVAITARESDGSFCGMSRDASSSAASPRCSSLAKRPILPTGFMRHSVRSGSTFPAASSTAAMVGATCSRSF